MRSIDSIALCWRSDMGNDPGEPGRRLTMTRQILRKVRYLLLALTVSGLACISIFDGCLPTAELVEGREVVLER